MATLSYIQNQGQRCTLDLDREITTIGRLPGQDLLLADTQVSRHHAVIIREGTDFRVEDQGSTRGTYLNGVKVKEAILSDGDVLQFGGKNTLKVQFLSQTSERRAYSDRTSLLDLLTPADAGPKSSARQMKQLNWLLTAARQLNDLGSIGDILRVLLQLTLELTKVERGFVFLCRDGEMRFAQGLDSSGAALEEDNTISRRAMREAVASGQKFFVGDTLENPTAGQWPSVLEHHIRSVYCIPLRKQNAEDEALLGLLYLDSRTTRGALSTVDHEVLDAISSQAAALVQNGLLAEAERKARLVREELALAARIHSGLMANKLPRPAFAEIAGQSVPCLSIGGDFYDAVELNNCVCLIITDVSGKGISAAIVAATLQGIIHAELTAGHDLPAIAATVNRFLRTRNLGKYATMLIIRVFSDGRIEYLNCGHIRPLVAGASGVRSLPEGDLIVGLIPDVEYHSTWDRLTPGDRLLLLTDGLLEAEDLNGEPFGEKRLQALAGSATLPEILRAVSTFHAPAEAQDDCTILELRYLGSPA